MVLPGVVNLKGWAWAALAGLVLGAGGAWTLCSRGRALEQAADHATIAAHETTIADLRARAARLDTVYTRDTVRLRSWRDRWDTLRLVTNRVDTLISIDTLRLVVRVADSTITACSDALGTCEERTAVLRSLVTADSSAIRALSRSLARAKIRSRLACVVGPSALPVAGTVKVGVVGASCGLQLF